MKVLLTNDDGIGRPGLAALVASFAAARHEVWVVAPAGERSGSACSLGTISDGVMIGATDRSDDPGHRIRRLAVDGPPALGVRAVCAGAFGWLPDIVVSGVNPSHNTGRMVLHSGTVGAALTAVSRDISGVAVSSSDESQEALSAAAHLAQALAEIVVATAAEPVALNLNVPGGPLDRLRGVASASLSEASIADVSFTVEGDGIRVRRIENDGPFAPGTDADLLQNGWASVTAMITPWSIVAPDESPAHRLHQWWVGRTSRGRQVGVDWLQQHG